MSKVFIGLDTFYTYFLWKKELVDMLDPTSERLDLVEVPEELVEEYDKLEAAWEHMTKRLAEIHREKGKV